MKCLPHDCRTGHAWGGMGAARARLPLLMWNGREEAYVISAVLVTWQWHFWFSNKCPGILYHRIIKWNSLNRWLFLTGSCSQFPPQTAASPDELKVYALWEAGDTYDQVKIERSDIPKYKFVEHLALFEFVFLGLVQQVVFLFSYWSVQFPIPTYFQLRGSS